MKNTGFVATVEIVGYTVQMCGIVAIVSTGPKVTNCLCQYTFQLFGLKYYSLSLETPMALFLRNISWRAAAPGLFFVAAVTLTTVALHCSPKIQRRFFVVPILVLNALALLSIDGDNTDWGPGGLDSVTGLTACIFAMCAPLFLCSKERSVYLELAGQPESAIGEASKLSTSHPDIVPPSKLTITTAWRIWNNPRALKFRNKEPGKQPVGVVLKFGIMRLLKLVAIVSADAFVIQPFVAHIDSGNFVEHYSPGQEPLIRRLILRDRRGGIFDSHVLSLRAVTSVWWIWTNLCALETGHAILAIISVSVLRLDDPSDWPHLYGNPLDAYTVRRFWGKFWHSIIAPSTWIWSCYAVRTLRVDKVIPQKAAAAFGVFLLSGLSHAAIAWRKGEGAAERDVAFFLANYGIVVIEMAISRFMRIVLKWLGCSWMPESKRMQIIGRYMGLLWVWTWFFWLTPRWLYPKFYSWSIMATN